MLRAVSPGCALLWMLSASANAGDEWESVADVSEVTVRVHWGSPTELNAAARSFGRRARGAPQAFSVLRKNTATGEFSCDIYLPRRPARLNDEPTASLGHEMAHCVGLAHDRRKRSPNGPLDTQTREAVTLARE